MSNVTYTRFNLRRVAHVASKIEGGLYWQASITMHATDAITDEIETARDIEALMRVDQFHTHGKNPMLAGVDFSYNPPNVTIEIDGESVPVLCVCTVRYRSYVVMLTEHEINIRAGERFENVPVEDSAATFCTCSRQEVNTDGRCIRCNKFIIPF